MANEKRLIDANMLMEQVKAIHKAVDTSKINTDYDTGFHSATSQVQGLIAYMPTVDAVEVVHGYNTAKARWFQCSECGYGFNDIFLLDESEEMLEPKYCAYCGAKMDGDGNA